MFILILMKTGLLGLNASAATTNFISIASQEVLLLKNSILLVPTAAPTIRTEQLNQITVLFCFYSLNMPKKKMSPKIKVTGLLGGKPRSELVEEAKQRRLEKIWKARDATETKRQEAMAKKANKDKEKRLQNQRKLEKQREEGQRQAKLVAARIRDRSRSKSSDVPFTSAQGQHTKSRSDAKSSDVPLTSAQGQHTKSQSDEES